MGRAAVVDDERESYVAFVRSRQRTLLRSAALVTGDADLAEDLLQQALVKLARHWRRVRHGDPDAYVRRTLYHDAVSRWRRERRVHLVPEPPDRAVPDRTGDVLERLALEQAMAVLTRKQRAVLVLRFLEDLSEAQAADVLGVSVGTVKSTTSNALARLRVTAEVEGARPRPARRSGE